MRAPIGCNQDEVPELKGSETTQLYALTASVDLSTECTPSPENGVPHTPNNKGSPYNFCTPVEELLLRVWGSRKYQGPGLKLTSSSGMAWL